MHELTNKKDTFKVWYFLCISLNAYMWKCHHETIWPSMEPSTSVICKRRILWCTTRATITRIVLIGRNTRGQCNWQNVSFYALKKKCYSLVWSSRSIEKKEDYLKRRKRILVFVDCSGIKRCLIWMNWVDFQNKDLFADYHLVNSNFRWCYIRFAYSLATETWVVQIINLVEYVIIFRQENNGMAPK